MDKTVLERIPGQGVKVMTESGTLTIADKHIYLDSSGGAFVVTLPNVSEAIGSIITFYIIGTGAFKVELVDSSDESEDKSAMEGLDLDIVNDGLVIFSNGLKWMILLNDIS